MNCTITVSKFSYKKSNFPTILLSVSVSWSVRLVGLFVCPTWSVISSFSAGSYTSMFLSYKCQFCSSSFFIVYVDCPEQLFDSWQVVEDDSWSVAQKQTNLQFQNFHIFRLFYYCVSP